MADHPQIEVCFHADHIEFSSYPYQPSSIYPSGNIPISAIREVDPGTAPPEIRIDGEILFIPATMKEEFQRFILENSLPVVKRIDVWDILLDPYLDTEFTKEDEERGYRILENCGISIIESNELRAFVADAMKAYNWTSMLWEWIHLGLFDVLEAFRGVLSGPNYKLAPREYEEFYWRAMEIAGRGKRLDGGKRDGE
jgi:hypothetical protein